MEDELQRLRADVQGLGEIIDQKDRANDATRRALLMAQADYLRLHTALVDWLNADGTSGFIEIDNDLAELAKRLRSSSDHPGAAILAVVDAAREAVTTQTVEAYAKLGWAVAEMEKGR